MDEIQTLIRTLAKHQYRSMSNVVGEFVEKRIAAAFGGVQASHCQKGFDVVCPVLGNVEVKSRNVAAKSMQCTLPKTKLVALDNFVLALVGDGKIERVMLFDKATLMSFQSKAGVVYVNKRHFDLAEDITEVVLNGPNKSFKPTPLRGAA